MNQRGSAGRQGRARVGLGLVRGRVSPEASRAGAGPRHRGPLQHRLRQRRQLDLLRARPGGDLRPRMTPVVFVIAGLIFACTAATYTEATTMFPEAGGSSSFARRAFNEFWSFFAAWGQMLTYIITVAISAFFVPHYLGVFWEPLGEGPGDIVGGIVVVVILGLLNIV